MPLVRNTDAFIEGGIKGILLFEATLTGLEEDIPNTFQEGKLQARIDYADVEVLEAEDAVTLEDDNFHFYFTQTNKSKSVAEKVITRYNAFAMEHNIEGLAIDNLEGMRLIWAREVIEYKVRPGQEPLSPAKFWYPVGKAGDDLDVIKKALKSGSGSKGGTKVDSSKALNDFILDASSMGVTEAGLKATIKSAPSGVRKAMLAGGGLDKVLTSLVATELLAEEDGVYTTVT